MAGTDVARVGRRVAYWRRRRNMSQQVFADRLGKSKSWVDKIERGVRRLDRYSVLQEIATQLRVDVRQLTDADAPLTEQPSSSLDALRNVLERADWLTGSTTSSHPDLVLRGGVAHAWAGLRRSSYDTLIGSTLPQLIQALPTVEASTDAADENTGAQLSGLRLRCEAYQVTCAALTRLDAYELAQLAADRALGAAHRIADPLLTGQTSIHAAYALLGAGRARTALDLCVHGARRIGRRTPPGQRPPTEHASTVGCLLSTAMLAAARLGDPDAVHQLGAAAARRADILGAEVNVPWGTFGPTSFTTDRVRATVDLGDAAGALVLDRAAVDRTALDQLVPAQRAQHLLTLSRAYLLTGDLAAAGRVLLDADRIAPGEVRLRPAAQHLLDELIRRDRTGETPAALTALTRQLPGRNEPA